MMIALHKNARTTPAIRAEIAASQESARSLAQRYGVTEATIYKWKKRDTFVDRSHTAHRLQTTLTPAQEAVVVHLRRSLLLPLDDLLAVTREFLCPKASRSGLDRCLRRHGAGNLRELMPQSPKPPHKAFKAYEPGYVHIDVKYLPQMQDETRRRYLFVAIDRATRWVFVAVKKDKTAASARSFLKALAKACPFRISKVLTDNGKEFTDRLFACRERQPTGEHEFDQLCQELGIEHRLTKPRTPKTNGMVERFNGRISDVLKTHHFHSGEDLEQTLLRYVQLYNHHLPQSALQSKTPMQAMRGWYDSQPHLFLRRPYDRPGLNTYLFGSVQGFRPFLCRLAVENGIRVLAIDYRLAPEHRFPAAQQDALAAYQWLLDQGHTPEQIVIAGDSAGGGLSCALLLQLKQLAQPQPRAALLFSPWVHPLASGGSMVSNLDYDILEADWLRDAIRMSMGTLDADHPLVAPVHADLTALAPMLIIGGEAEIFRDQIIRFAQHLRDAGGDVELELWPQMMHDFQILFPDLPQSKSAMARVGQFLARL